MDGPSVAERGRPDARRREGEYSAYSTDEQRSDGPARRATPEAMRNRLFGKEHLTRLVCAKVDISGALAPARTNMAPHARLFFVDFLRALAAQGIVLHHLAFYGPLSDHARTLAPTTIDWLYEHARMAVQIFFVTAGYFAARSLSRRAPGGLRAAGRLMVDRYRRIGLPYWAALAVCLVANELARGFADLPSISASPTLPQIVAHALLLHDVLGYPALTAGIWFLAVDMQLYFLTTLLCALAARLWTRRGPWVAQGVLAGLGLVSAFWWNRIQGLDRYALYFLGSYALGLVVAWAEQRRLPRAFLWAYLAALVGAQFVEFRPRLGVATLTALLLAVAGQRGWLTSWPKSKLIQRLGETSYSLFLVHFPVSLLITAYWSSRLPPDPWLSLAGMAVCYLASLAVAFPFHALETRLVNLGSARPAPATARTRAGTGHDPRMTIGMGLNRPASLAGRGEVELSLNPRMESRRSAGA